MMDDKLSESMRDMQEFQENFMEQGRNTASMFQDFIKKSSE